MRGNKKYGEGVQTILTALRHGPKTSSEIAKQISWPLDKVCATICGLVKSGKVIPFGRTRNPETGFNVKIWKINLEPHSVVSKQTRPEENPPPRFDDKLLVRCLSLGRSIRNQFKARMIRFK